MTALFLTAQIKDRLLELAAQESAEKKFQYIVALNSAQMLFDNSTENFRNKFNNAVKIHLPMQRMMRFTIIKV